jgi:hypothetical protein
MKKIKIHIKSADISEERYKELTAVPFKKRPPSKEEKAKHSKLTIVNILTCVGMLLASNVSAGIGLFVGKDLDIELLAIFFYVITLGLIYAGFKGMYATLKGHFGYIFKDTRNKTPEQAITSFFKVFSIDDYSHDFDKEIVPNSYDAFLGMTPELISVEYDKFYNYLKNFRNMIQQFVERGYKDFFNVSTLPDGHLSVISHDIPKEYKRAAYTFMSKTIAYLKFYKINQQNFESMYYAEFEIELELLLIKSGQFWFVTDPMPTYTITEEEPTVKTESETEKAI